MFVKMLSLACLALFIGLIGACEEGWSFHAEGQLCYKYIQDAKTWNNAEADCKAMGAMLATVRSASANAFIDGMKGDAAIMLGFQDKVTEGTFKQTDGKSASYSNWRRGEPNNVGGGEDCTMMYDNGEWNDIKCDRAEMNYVCEKPVCPSGWTYNPSNQQCYMKMSKAAKFNQASKKCNKKGAWLALPCSAEENEFLKNFADARIHIGYKRVSKGGNFASVDASNQCFENWSASEPNNLGGDEGCTEMYTSGKWNDNQCSHERPYVCQKHAPF